MMGVSSRRRMMRSSRKEGSEAASRKRFFVLYTEEDDIGGLKSSAGRARGTRYEATIMDFHSLALRRSTLDECLFAAVTVLCRGPSTKS